MDLQSTEIIIETSKEQNIDLAVALPEGPVGILVPRHILIRDGEASPAAK